MAFLQPDKTRTEYGLVIKEKIIPFGTKWTRNWGDYKIGDLYKADRKLSNGTGKVQYITVHNTNDIQEAVGTNDAEQYSRATWNQNMGDARVHYYIDEVDCWQLLREDEVGWHAGDGRGDGNETTLSIEIIMDGSGSANDKNAEDRGAKLAAILLYRHKLTIDKMVTHQKWSGKYCPAYILPHWATFKSKVEKYLQEISKPATAPASKCNGKIDGYNTTRGANQLIIYNKGANAATNQWGTEVAVDANGIATCAPVYGVGKMAIPTGGYVISGHGDASTWVGSNIKKGSKITISNNVITVGAVVSTTATTNSTIKVGSVVKVKTGAKTYEGGNLSSFVYNRNHIVKSISKDRVVITFEGVVVAAIKLSDLILVSGGTTTTTNKTTQTNTATIKVGSTVKLKQGAKTYTGGSLASFVYDRKHIVKEISGDKAVITYNGTVVAAVKLSDLTLA